MMTFVPGTVPNMSGVVWTLEGDASAVSAVRRIVQLLGGKVCQIDRKYKSLYHAFGAFLSPLLVAVPGRGVAACLASGISRRDLAALMRPIVEQTLQNLFANIHAKTGPGKAFSGPLIRGDVSTIESHIRALKRPPNARSLYVALVAQRCIAVCRLGTRQRFPERSAERSDNNFASCLCTETTHRTTLRLLSHTVG